MSFLCRDIRFYVVIGNGYSKGFAVMTELATIELSVPRLARTSSQMITYGNVAIWLSLLRQDFGFSVVTVSRQ